MFVQRTWSGCSEDESPIAATASIQTGLVISGCAKDAGLACADYKATRPHSAKHVTPLRKQPQLQQQTFNQNVPVKKCPFPLIEALNKSINKLPDDHSPPSMHRNPPLGLIHVPNGSAGKKSKSRTRPWQKVDRRKQVSFVTMQGSGPPICGRTPASASP